MTAVLVALLGGVMGAVGGYIFGVLRVRTERRDERRDEAIAGTFKEMMLFYRGVISWTADPDGKGPVTEPDTRWEDYCRKRYAVFIDVFFGNSIWLGSETEELIKEFAQSGADILNELSGMDPAGYLPDGTSASERRANTLMPKLDKIEDALRAEMEASRALIPRRKAIKVRRQ